MQRLIGFVCASFVFASPAVTLEQFMSKPFVSDLTSGPGGRIAWVENVRGARNVWVAEPPAYRGRALTQFTQDDGQDIGGLEWSTDGQGVLFVRGGDLEHPRSEIPNPLNLATGAGQAVWLARLDGVPRKLADGGAVAARADAAVFVKTGSLYSIAFTDAAKPVELAKPRGGMNGLRMAPDGSAVAFVSTRRDHSFIGVYRFSDQKLLFLDPSVDNDDEPVWSADSKQIAFVRVAASSAQRFGPVRAVPDPWSIRVANAATGEGREIWRAGPGPGSAFRGIPGTALQWTSTSRIVFPWERDGWLHLYSVATTGGVATLLTPGEFEVEHVTLASDRRSIYFSSNQNDIDRRHIWRVDASGEAPPSAVTSGRGLEWKPAAINAGVAYIQAGTQQPTRVVTRTTQGEREVSPAPEFPAAQLVEPEAVVFSAADGMQIHGQLFVPREGTGKRPAVIFFHGGSRRQMLLGWHYNYYYNNAYAMNQYLASLGYLVLSVNYRSGIGYGLNFREAIRYGAAGASEYNDVIGAGLYLRSRPDVDAKRIGLWGGSYGGYLTALGLARASDLFAAGVDLHGVHDWSKLRNLEPGAADARTAFDSSPMAAVATWRSPVLLIHGDDDRNVPFSETVRLAEALRAQKVDFAELIFPDEIHDFLVHAHWVAAYRAGAAFFASRMK